MANCPAFPIREDRWRREHSDFHGLTKREYFAALAMQSYLSRGYSSPEQCATWSTRYADALLAELEKSK